MLSKLFDAKSHLFREKLLKDLAKVDGLDQMSWAAEVRPLLLELTKFQNGEYVLKGEARGEHINPVKSYLQSQFKDSKIKGLPKTQLSDLEKRL